MKHNNIWIRSALLTLTCLTMGIILLTAVYALPVGRMKSHVADSDELFNYEGVYPQIIQGYKSSQLDNYTDSLMYATAIHPGSGNPLTDAMQNARYEYEDTNMVQSLNDYANDVSVKEDLKYEMTYPRYWHGYLVALKPLLLFFNVSEIRMLSMMLQGVLLLLLLFLVGKKLGDRYQIPVVLLAVVLNPIVLPLSLQFSWVYYVGMIGAVWIMCMKNVISTKNYLLLFLTLGMATSYMDLLTYPLFTLGLPLVLLLLFQKRLEWKSRVGITVKAAATWGAGYGIMWVGKWIFAYFFADLNLFADVSGKILQRTSMVGEEAENLTTVAVILRNMQVLFKEPFLLVIVLSLVGTIVIWIRKGGRRPGKSDFLQTVPYLMIMILPVAWIALLSNHSWVHYWFTYRELSVTVLAGVVWIMEVFFPGKTNVEEMNDG